MSTDTSNAGDAASPLQHLRAEQSFFVEMIVVVWAAILSGFIYKNLRRFYTGTLTYPWIVHIHAVVFVAWLAALMVVLRLMTAIVTEMLKFGKPYADMRFLSIMFADMIPFGGLIAAGMLPRSPDPHKRLMLVATLLLTDARFGRGLSPQISV